MFFAACFILLVAVSRGSAQASGKELVETISNSLLNIFPDDHGFMTHVACAESHYGTNPNTYRPGYYGGIWQVDEIGFKATQDTVSHPGLKDKFRAIQNQYGIDWTTVEWQKLVTPLYSGIAARLFISNIPHAIPSDIPSQAVYWKQY